VSPEATTRPFDMLMSEPEAATAQRTTAKPAKVCRVAKATVPPTALVSDVIGLAVATPEDDAPKNVALPGRVAIAAPGLDTEPPVGLNTSLPDVPMSAVTALVAASRAEVE